MLIPYVFIDRLKYRPYICDRDRLETYADICLTSFYNITTKLSQTLHIKEELKIRKVILADTDC